MSRMIDKLILEQSEIKKAAEHIKNSKYKPATCCDIRKAFTHRSNGLVTLYCDVCARTIGMVTEDWYKDNL